MRILLLCFLIAGAICAHAAARDSLMAKPGVSGWDVLHRVVAGETLISLSLRYRVPAAILATENGLNVSDSLTGGRSVLIPVGFYNLIIDVPASPDTAQPFYYRINPRDELYNISNYAGIAPEIRAKWRWQCIDSKPPAGKVVQLGWIRYDPPAATPSQAPATARMIVHIDTPKYLFHAPDTAGIPIAAKDTAIPLLQQLWNEQTGNGQNVIEEKGSAGFFSISTKTRGASVYAFHSSAARGTVMLVRNLNNGRSIYVKVLGLLPQTKQFAGCILGLSNGAKSALGVQETKAFCELRYAGY